MNKDLKDAFDALQQQKDRTLDIIQHLTPEELNHSPGDGKWSVAHILSHIITAERLSGLYIRKKMQGAAEAKDSGTWEDLKFFFLKISQRMPGLKFRAPTNVVERTEVYHDIETIQREWRTVREDLGSLLERIPDQYAKRKIYRHVRAGYLSPRH